MNWILRASIWVDLVVVFTETKMLMTFYIEDIFTSQNGCVWRVCINSTTYFKMVYIGVSIEIHWTIYYHIFALRHPPNISTFQNLLILGVSKCVKESYIRRKMTWTSEDHFHFTIQFYDFMLYSTTIFRSN